MNDVHDVFISYSRRDMDFARALEGALEKYAPPKSLPLSGARSHGHIRVFRDQSDLTGVEYYQSIERHLSESRKLVLLCSPRARASEFVNDEVRKFVALRGAQNIVPLLIDGLPNNEASAEQEGLKAFPDALCEAMQMPLAGDYRSVDARRDKLNKGSHYGTWYTLLANLLDVSRSDIEQRDQKRAARRRAITIGTVTGIIVLLSVAFLVTLFAQREAVRQRDAAEHRRLVALTQLVASRATDQAADGNKMWAKLLARQAYLFDERADHEALAEVDAALRIALKDAPATHQVTASEPFHSSAVSADGTLLATGSTDGTITLSSLVAGEAEPRTLRLLEGHEIDVVSLAFSPDGRTLASGSWDETVRLWNLAAPESEPQVLHGHTEYVWSVAFSPDGKWLASGSDDGTVRLWSATDARAAPVVFQVPDGAVRSVAFNTDGRRLAAGTSVGTVLLWDPAMPSSPPRMFMTPGSSVTSVALSAGDRTLAASIDRSVFLWNVADAAAAPRTITREFDVARVAFSPDGALLAIGQVDVGLPASTIELWQVGKLDAPPTVLARPAGADALEFGSERLVAVGRGGGSGQWHVTLQRWRVPTQALADAVCREVQSNLPAVPWERLVGADVPYERTCARHGVHPDYFIWAENLAEAGQLERALAALKRADELDNPGKPPPDRGPELRPIAAKGYVVRADAIARHGDYRAAAALYARAYELHAASVPPASWKTLCEKGTATGHATDVAIACERAGR